MKILCARFRQNDVKSYIITSPGTFDVHFVLLSFVRLTPQRNMSYMNINSLAPSTYCQILSSFPITTELYQEQRKSSKQKPLSARKRGRPLCPPDFEDTIITQTLNDVARPLLINHESSSPLAACPNVHPMWCGM
jgi:hypothetical protein